MSTIDQSRLLDIRSAILGQNAALQKAAGKGDPGAAAEANGFGGTMSSALAEIGRAHV